MKVFEIKKGRTWKTVKSESMKTVNQFCKDNGFSNWRVKGMMSRSEMNINLETV